MVTDPAHVEIAKLLRREHAARRDADARQARRHGDGHAVMRRALPDYDALFGIDTDTFTPTPDTSVQDESSAAVTPEASPS